MKIFLYPLFLVSLLELILLSQTKSRVLATEAQRSPLQPIAQATPAQYSFEDYKKECLQRATREKLPPDVAQDLCNCTINQFRSQYTIEQFRALVRTSKNNSTAAETLTEVGEVCFEEVLYEE
jgi:hypothetical protein